MANPPQQTALEPMTFAEAIAGVRLIPLTGGKCAIIDLEDVPRVVFRKWSVRLNAYAGCGKSEKNGMKAALMHRHLLNAPAGSIVDHKNGDGFDNRRSNLRFATHSQNLRNRPAPKSNTSGLKGVSWVKHRRRWGARIMRGRKYAWVGLFDDKQEAGAAYERAAKELHGEFYCNPRS